MQDLLRILVVHRPTVPHVYVAGDVTGDAALAPAGIAEGRVAGSNAARGLPVGGAVTDPVRRAAELVEA